MRARSRTTRTEVFHAKTKIVNKTNTAPDTAPVGTRVHIVSEDTDWSVVFETKFADGTEIVRTVRPSDLTAAQRNKISGVIADAYAKALELAGYT